VAVAALAMFEMTSGCVVWISHAHVYATAVRLGIVRANELIAQGSGKGTYGRSLARACHEKALQWRAEGCWDLSTEAQSALSFHEVTETIPLVLVQGCEPSQGEGEVDICSEIANYFRSSEFSQQRSGPQDEKSTVSEEPGPTRPNRFHYCGEVDRVGVLKGAYALSVHLQHRSKCVFNSFV
jgi:hypothetical protein